MAEQFVITIPLNRNELWQINALPKRNRVLANYV
jgi:hypothetical protein